MKGQLLGFSPPVMSREFGGIDEFAELWEIAGLPLKYYSSGMDMRPVLAL
jgi:ABC-type polysaccharide/polyol phosphate transport system ATPase subunit